MKNKILSVLFLITIFSIMLLGIIIPDKDISVSERRKLSKFPSLEIETIMNGEFFEDLSLDVYKRCVNEVDDYAINDISRVIDLCSKNDLAVSKIYFTGNSIKGFDRKVGDKLDLSVERVIFNSLDEKDGKGYVLEIDDIDFSESYINALGLCIYPML